MGKNIQSSGSPSREADIQTLGLDDAPNGEVGFVEQLYRSCLDLFSAHWRRILDSSAKEACAKFPHLKDSLGRFFLWGESFHEGQLDALIEVSDELKETIIELLSGIANMLTSPAIIYIAGFDPTDAHDKIRKQISDVGQLVEKAQCMIRSDDEDDSDDGNSVPVERDYAAADASKTIELNIRCLMQLNPTLEKISALSPSAEDHDSSSSPVSFQVSEPARPYVMKIYEKFPDADVKLVERLGEANWQRHSRVRQLMQTTEPANNATSDGGGTTSTPAHTKDTRFCDQPQAESAVIPTSIFHDSGLGGSLPIQSSYAKSVASHTSVLPNALEFDGKAGLRVPTTPTEEALGNPFECFICRRRLVNIKNKVDWM
ncbi:MAG: hypothetical protein M1833_003507 [Piccolia ochrophora]|nr:MAG: hypothetical protein M1833_003507 [Piccolia ochrophora]